MSLLEDIFVAYYNARTHKRNTANQLRFEMELEENLVGLYREINERRYEVGRSVCFMIDNPVRREVFAADFRDRVVHHLLFNYINPIFEPTFITDCYSCRKGERPPAFQQLFSNIYLNEFDNHVKRVLGIRHYGRYVDDFYLVHNDRRFLLSLIPTLRDYLLKTRGATLHPQKIRLMDHRQGIPFLGAIVKPYRVGLSGRTFRQFNQCLGRWHHKLAQSDESDMETLAELRASVNSYLGLMVHFNCVRRKKEVIGKHPFLYRFGYFGNRMDKFLLKKKEKERLMSGVTDATASAKCDV